MDKMTSPVLGVQCWKPTRRRGQTARPLKLEGTTGGHQAPMYCRHGSSASRTVLRHPVWGPTPTPLISMSNSKRGLPARVVW